MKHLIFIGSLVLTILSVSSCCDTSLEEERIYIKYPKLNGKENTYGTRVIRTRKGDFSYVIDTLYKYTIVGTKEVEAWISLSKDELPAKQENQPDLIFYVEIVATTFNGLTKDSVIYQDTISNIQYEFGRCKVENYSYEFNGVTTNSREIVIDD